MYKYMYVTQLTGLHFFSHVGPPAAASPLSFLVSRCGRIQNQGLSFSEQSLPLEWIEDKTIKQHALSLVHVNGSIFIATVVLQVFSVSCRINTDTHRAVIRSSSL